LSTRPSALRPGALTPQIAAEILQGLLPNYYDTQYVGPPASQWSGWVNAYNGGRDFSWTINVPHEVSLRERYTGDFLNTKIGAATLHFLNAGSFGTVALVDRNDALGLTGRNAPVASTIGSVAGGFSGSIPGLLARGTERVVTNLGIRSASSAATNVAGNVATAGSRATLDAISRANLRAIVGQTGTLAEARGVVYAQREGLRLGYDTVLPSLTYRGSQGIDLALQSSVTGRYAIWEAKGGASQASLSALSTDTLGITQGSARFIDTRLRRYLDFGNGMHLTVAMNLQNARLSGSIDSFASFFGSRTTYQFPLIGAGVRPAVIVP
jgi:hypothetical protein